MNGLENTIKEFGLQVGLIIILLVFSWSILKWIGTYFIRKMDEASAERKAITEKHEHFMENHIHESSEAMRNLFNSIKEFRNEMAQGFNMGSIEHKSISDGIGRLGENK